MRSKSLDRRAERTDSEYSVDEFVRASVLYDPASRGRTLIYWRWWR